MRASLSSDTVVIGVGNTILSDDGVGVHAARLLQSDPRVPAGRYDSRRRHTRTRIIAVCFGRVSQSCSSMP